MAIDASVLKFVCDTRKSSARDVSPCFLRHFAESAPLSFQHYNTTSTPHESELALKGV
jgi:hypothetical protein